MKTILYKLNAPTIAGTQHARSIGTPTLNFALMDERLPIKIGIYAGYVTIRSAHFPAVIHYGPRPFLGDSTLSLEAHLLDTWLTQSPSSATVEFTTYLRPVQNFRSEESLRDQIRKDIALARRSVGVAQ